MVIASSLHEITLLKMHMGENTSALNVQDIDKMKRAPQILAMNHSAEDKLTEESIDTADDTRHGINRSDISSTDFESSSPTACSTPAISSRQEKATRKGRSNFEPELVQSLERALRKNLYPESGCMDKLAEELGISKKQIKIWFQNKRARGKKRAQPSHQYPSTNPQVVPCAFPMIPSGYPLVYMPSPLMPFMIPTPFTNMFYPESSALYPQHTAIPSFTPAIPIRNYGTPYLLP